MFIVKYSFFTQDSADGVPAIGLSDLKFHINSVCRDFGVFETVRCLNAYKYRSNQSSGEIIFLIVRQYNRILSITINGSEKISIHANMT